MTQSPTPEELEGLLEPGEDQPWHEHDGTGRPHSPKSFVEVELRDGQRVRATSAFIPFVWDDSGEDVIRWRLAKEYPSAMFLASHVPDLLSRIRAQAARIRALEEALEPFAEVAGLYDEQEDDSHEVWTDRAYGVPSEHFRLANYRRARAALTLNKENDDGKS